jgi:drug/metabolite transporter (DMT)-like permease
VKPGPRLTLATLVLVILIWGSTWSVIRVGLVGVPPLTGVAIRFGIAGLVLFLVGLANRVPFGKGKNEKKLWVTTSVFTFSLCYIIVYWGEQYVPSGLAAVLWATFPLFVALLARVVIPGEIIRPATVVGMIVSLAGMAIIYSEDFRLLGGPKVLFAAVVFLLSPLASAIGNTLVKRWGQGSHPLSTAAVPMMLTAVLVGVLALLFERGRPVTWDTRSVSALLYLAILGTSTTFGLYYWLLNWYPATRLSLTANVTPIVAVTIGALFMHEPLTPRVLVGSAVVLGGVAVAMTLGAATRKA